MYYDVSHQFDDSHTDDTLKLVHVNARSLQKNFDQLYEFLASLHFTPHVICISASRINSDPLININIPNYSFFHVKPKYSRAGGVAVYTHVSLNYQLCPNQPQFANSESLWIKLSGRYTSSHTVSVINRHPCNAATNDFNNFIFAHLVKLKFSFYCIFISHSKIKTKTEI